MAVGTVRLNDTARATSRATANPDAFGAGVGRALGSLANAQADKERSLELIQQAQQRRADSQEDFSVQESWIRFQGEQTRVQEERLRNMGRDGAGVTNQTDEEVRDATAAFRATLPERLQDEYDVRIATFEENKVNGSFAAEYQQGNLAFRETVTNVVSDVQELISQSDMTLEDASIAITDLIEMSDLPDLEREQLLAASVSVLQATAFTTEAQLAATNQLPIREATGEDVVLGGLQGWQRGFLNGVAAPESGGAYNVRYGGEGGAQHFDNYDDHPRVFETIHFGSHKGQKSSAAGRYQFTATTWDFVLANAPAELGITDFSPINQDKAALWYAEHVYNTTDYSSAHPWSEVMSSGNREQLGVVKSLLSATWQGFEGMSDDAFANAVLGSAGIAGGGTGSPTMPNPFTDPQYADLTFDMKNSLMADAAAAAADLRSQQFALAAQQRAASVRELELQAYNGETTSEQRQAAADALGLDADERKSLEAQATNFQTRVQSRNIVLGRLNSGDTFTRQDDNEGLNNLFGQQGHDALANQDADYVQNAILPVLGQTGFIPSDMAEQLASMARSNNAQHRQFALQTLAQIQQGSPDAISQSYTTGGLDEGLAGNVEAYRVLNQFLTAEEAGERLNRRADPAQRQRVADLEDEAREIAEGFDIDSTTRRLSHALLLGDRPVTEAMTPQQRGVFSSEYAALFVEGYTLFENQGQAEDWATKQMQEVWGPSPFSGPARLMKNPPTRSYPMLGGTFDWIEKQAWNEPELQQWAGSGRQLILQSDTQTAAEADAFRNWAGGSDGSNQPANNASYRVFLYDPDTEEHSAVLVDGVQKRIAFEQTEEMRAEQRSIDLSIHADTRVDNTQDELNNVEAQIRMADEIIRGDPTADTPAPAWAVEQREELIAKQTELTERVNAARDAAAETAVPADAIKLNRRVEDLITNMSPALIKAAADFASLRSDSYQTETERAMIEAWEILQERGDE